MTFFATYFDKKTKNVLKGETAMQKMKTITDENSRILLQQLGNVIDYNNQMEFTYTIVDQRDVISDYSHKIDVLISKNLNEVGIPRSLKGYRYIVTSIKEVLRDETVLDGVTKILYPTVAKIHNSTPQRVEKAIRHAIEVAWSRNEDSKLKDEFKYAISKGKTRPTNSEFIATLSQYIKMS